MIIKKVIAALLILGLSTAANADFITTGAIESDGRDSTLDHTIFSVLSRGLITISLRSTDDPEMNLWRSDGAGNLLAFIENDDDGGPGYSSRIRRVLAAGIYAIVSGEYAVANLEQRFAHYNPEYPSNPYTLRVRGGDARYLFSREGNLNGTYTSTRVSAPGTLTLFGIGLLGLGLARRRAA